MSTPNAQNRAVLSLDTAADIEAMQVSYWRSLSPTDKARRVSEISQAVELLALAGIQQRFPDASPREWFLRLAMLKLGRDLASRAYPEIVNLAG